MQPFESGVLGCTVNARLLTYAQGLKHRLCIIDLLVFVVQSYQWHVDEGIEGAFTMTSVVTIANRSYYSSNTASLRRNAGKLGNSHILLKLLHAFIVRYFAFSCLPTNIPLTMTHTIKRTYLCFELGSFKMCAL